MDNRNAILERLCDQARLIKNTVELYDNFKSYESPMAEEARGMVHAELFMLQRFCEQLDTALDGEEALE